MKARRRWVLPGWVLTAFVALYTAYALVRRVATLIFTHDRNPVDVAAVGASIVLISLAIWQYTHKQLRRALLLYAAEFVLGAFIFARVDYPLTVSLGNRLGPPVAIFATHVVDAFNHDAENQRVHAYARLDARNGAAAMAHFNARFIDHTPATTFLAVSDCTEYQHLKSALAIDGEPLVGGQGRIAWADAFCAHLEANEALAIQKYGAAAPIPDSKYLASLLAYGDGDDFAAAAFIRRMRVGTASDRDLYARITGRPGGSPFVRFIKNVR